MLLLKFGWSVAKATITWSQLTFSNVLLGHARHLRLGIAGCLEIDVHRQSARLALKVAEVLKGRLFRIAEKVRSRRRIAPDESEDLGRTDGQVWRAVGWKVLRPQSGDLSGIGWARKDTPHLDDEHGWRVSAASNQHAPPGAPQLTTCTATIYEWEPGHKGALSTVQSRGRSRMSQELSSTGRRWSQKHRFLWWNTVVSLRLALRLASPSEKWATRNYALWLDGGKPPHTKTSSGWESAFEKKQCQRHDNTAPGNR